MPAGPLCGFSIGSSRGFSLRSNCLGCALVCCIMLMFDFEFRLTLIDETDFRNVTRLFTPNSVLTCCLSDESYNCSRLYEVSCKKLIAI